MGKYSIKELEKLSGIKAHTIRIWEKRYQIVSPSRTETNIRFYSDEDLKKVINVSLLNNNGIKISRIAEFTSDELAKKVGELSEAKSNLSVHIDQLIVAMIDLEEEAFGKVLSAVISKIGFEKTITDVVYPFLEKIGVLWQTNNISPAQEHFISNLLRQKILVAIDALPLAPKNRKRVLLFLPENELHELGLLFYYYAVKRAGFRAYYFGQMVPYADVLSMCESHSPTILVTAITTSPAPHSVEAFLSKLCKDLPKVTVLATGYALKKIALKIPKNLHLFGSVNELNDLLKGIKPV